MKPLLALPEVDELQLTEAEIEKMTDTKMPRLQIAWLQTNGWAFTLSRAGRPVVGRLYANLKLSGVEVATIVAPQGFELNMSAIQ